MKMLTILNLPATLEKVREAALKFGDQLRVHPHYQRLIQAITTLEKDTQVCDLFMQILTKHNTRSGRKGAPNTMEDDYVG